MPRRADRPRRPLPPGFGTIWSTVALDLLGFGIVLPILTIYGERFGASPTTLGLLSVSVPTQVKDLAISGRFLGVLSST